MFYLFGSYYKAKPPSFKSILRGELRSIVDPSVVGWANINEPTVSGGLRDTTLQL